MENVQGEGGPGPAKTTFGVLQAIWIWISWFTNKSVPQLLKRATNLVLTSGKEEKYVICPSTLNCAVRVGKLRIYTVQNPPEILLKLAPPGG